MKSGRKYFHLPLLPIHFLLITVVFMLLGGFAWAYTPSSLPRPAEATNPPADTTKKSKPRFPVKTTTPITLDDTKKKMADLKDPDNIKEEEEYDEHYGGGKRGNVAANFFG